MGMNDAELDRVVGELGRLVGRRLEGVRQPQRDRVILRFEDGTSILLVPRGPHARIHTADHRPTNPRKPFSFQGLLRARLHGPLTAIHRVPGDRIVDLGFGEQVLHLRLTGRSGGLWLLEDGKPIGAYDGPASTLPPVATRPARVEETPRFAPLDGPDGWNRATEHWFAARERGGAAQSRREAVLRSARRHLVRLDRLAENLTEDLEKSEASASLRRDADALAASLYQVARGQESALVVDLDDPDVLRAIRLDPRISPGQNLEGLYKRVRRLERVGERSLERLIEVQERAAHLRALLADLDETAPPHVVDALERLVPREGQATEDERALPWSVWTGPAGARALVGRNAAANRKLTFQQARGNDWWLHLRDKPGPHVILQIPGGASPSLETLLAVAQIVLVASRIDVGERADVQYTRVKNVKAIPGEIGGRVVVHSERVLHVVRDPAAFGPWIKVSPG